MMITVVTGAGVSSSAGIPTYRAQNSLWADEKFHKYSNAKEYGNHLDFLKPKWFEMMQNMNSSSPTPFHHFVAKKGWNVVTQNIDGLHTRAGSQNVIEIHGSIRNWRRLKSQPNDVFSSDKVQERDGKILADLINKDNSVEPVERIRPDIVLFGEKLKKAEEAIRLITYSDVVIYAGTSGNVYPVADWYVNSFGRKILVDPVSWGKFDENYTMRADDWIKNVDLDF